VAFTKDISKFCQCVEANEAAQHVRRILWRFGDKSKEPTIFVTTRVNYGERPAGCIAIAAVRETADRFGKGRETAAWVLKNRTYMDDATGGASSTEKPGRCLRTWRTSWKMGDSGSRRRSCQETRLRKEES
jgi:hypothetical protein